MSLCQLCSVTDRLSIWFDWWIAVGFGTIFYCLLLLSFTVASIPLSIVMFGILFLVWFAGWLGLAVWLLLVYINYINPCALFASLIYCLTI